MRKRKRIYSMNDVQNIRLLQLMHKHYDYLPINHAASRIKFLNIENEID